MPLILAADLFGGTYCVIVNPLPPNASGDLPTSSFGKEVKVSGLPFAHEQAKIDDHDYETKKSNVIRFLEKGSKVKVTIMFRGREQSRPELGTRLLDRLAEDVADYGIVESKPKQDGRNMTMVFGPVRKGKK